MWMGATEKPERKKYRTPVKHIPLTISSMIASFVLFIVCMFIVGCINIFSFSAYYVICEVML